MKLVRFFEDQGQTTVEYMLILVVSLSIGVAFKKKMEDFMLKNPNSYISKSLGRIQSDLEADSSGRYRYFTVR
jgi:hypothetical protein